MCVVLPERSTVAVCDECKEQYCTECIDTHTCGTNVMMHVYCSRYLNNAHRFYWRLMRLCYPNPPFSQLAKVLTKIALKGARVVLCTPVCNFLELGQFGSPNSKGVSKGCAWGPRGEPSLKVARRARAGQTFPQAPGPGLTVTFTEFSDHGFYGHKVGKV